MCASCACHSIENNQLFVSTCDNFDWRHIFYGCTIFHLLHCKFVVVRPFRSGWRQTKFAGQHPPEVSYLLGPLDDADNAPAFVFAERAAFHNLDRVAGMGVIGLVVRFELFVSL